MKMRAWAVLVVAFACLTVAGFAVEVPAGNVIVVTLDGMRWQEVFGGAERAPVGEDFRSAVPAAIEGKIKELLAQAKEMPQATSAGP